jgi:hypothetical protein
MPAFNTRAAAMSLGISAKSLENLFSHLLNPTAPHGVQGRDRRIPLEVILRIAVAQDIRDTFGCSWSRALGIAERLEASGQVLSTGALLFLRADIDSYRARLRERLTEATESVLARRRGRPSSRS